MRFLVTSWLVAGVMIGASGCDAPEGPEAPPPQDPAEQPMPDPMDQPMHDPMDQPAPGEPEDWDQPRGAGVGDPMEPAAAGGYEVVPAQAEDPYGSDRVSDHPSPVDPMEQPASRETESWDEPQPASDFGGAPAPLPAEPAGAPGADPMEEEDQVFSPPAMPAETMGE